MAAKVETLRIGTQMGQKRPSVVRSVAAAARRWVRRGQIGSSDLEMRTYTGAR